MNEIREMLIDKVATVFGTTNPATVAFARLCESYAEGRVYDHMLKAKAEGLIAMGPFIDD